MKEFCPILQNKIQQNFIDRRIYRLLPIFRSIFLKLK